MHAYRNSLHNLGWSKRANVQPHSAVNVQQPIAFNWSTNPALMAMSRVQIYVNKFNFDFFGYAIARAHLNTLYRSHRQIKYWIIKLQIKIYEQHQKSKAIWEIRIDSFRERRSDAIPHRYDACLIFEKEWEQKWRDSILMEEILCECERIHGKISSNGNNRWKSKITTLSVCFAYCMHQSRGNTFLFLLLLYDFNGRECEWNERVFRNKHKCTHKETKRKRDPCMLRIRYKYIVKVFP